MQLIHVTVIGPISLTDHRFGSHIDSKRRTRQYIAMRLTDRQACWRSDPRESHSLSEALRRFVSSEPVHKVSAAAASQVSAGGRALMGSSLRSGTARGWRGRGGGGGVPVASRLASPRGMFALKLFRRRLSACEFNNSDHSPADLEPAQRPHSENFLFSFPGGAKGESLGSPPR